MSKAKIELRWIPVGPGRGGERSFNYRTLSGAAKRARSLVGSRPRIDPDGYLVNQITGGCLFVNGAEPHDLFPHIPKEET